MTQKATEVARIAGGDNARQFAVSQHGADRTKAMAEADTREVHSKKDAQNVSVRVKRDGEKDARDKRRRRGGGGSATRGSATSGTVKSGTGDFGGVGGEGTGTGAYGEHPGHIDIRL